MTIVKTLAALLIITGVLLFTIGDKVRAQKLIGWGIIFAVLGPLLGLVLSEAGMLLEEYQNDVLLVVVGLGCVAILVGYFRASANWQKRQGGKRGASTSSKRRIGWE
jgi:hypothetical protein